MRSVAATIAAGLALATAGCVAPQQAAFDGTGPAFAPERYFAGRTRLWGVVEGTDGGPATQFDGHMAGRRDADGAVAIDESISYPDGSKLARSWRIRRLDGQRIEATGNDIAGIGIGEVSGRMLHLRYALARDSAGRTAGLDVEHWMYLQDDGVTVLNRTVTRRAGQVVRMATERLVRAEEPKLASLRKPSHAVAGAMPAARPVEGVANATLPPPPPRAVAAQEATGSIRTGSDVPPARPAAEAKSAREGSWIAFDLRR